MTYDLANKHFPEDSDRGKKSTKIREKIKN